MTDYELNQIRNEDANMAVVFIHGFVGNRDETWGKFPLLIASETSDLDIYTIGYNTSLTPDIRGIWAADPNLSMVAKRVVTNLQNLPPVSEYSQLAIVAHSMGGLVAQKALLDSPQLTDRTRKFMCFGTPSAGLRKASFLRFWKRSLADMSIDSPFILDLRNDWENKFGDNPPFDFGVVAGSQDEFVPYRSFLAPFPDRFQWVINGNHVSMIKPDDKNAEAVRALKAFLTDDGATSDVNLLNDEITEVSASSNSEIVQAALLLDHQGKREESIEFLENTDKKGTDALGVLGGRYKRIWLEDETNPEYGQKAKDLYEKALKQSQKNKDSEQIYYHAINIAFLRFVFTKERSKAKELASLALEHAQKSQENIWSVATKAEANLYLGDRKKALLLYQSLPKLAKEPWQLSSALQQSFRVIAELDDLKKTRQPDQTTQDKEVAYEPTETTVQGQLDLEQVADAIANLESTGGHLFISYAHDDEEWLNRFKKHLDGFVLNGDVTYDFWHDKRIKPGQEWKPEIQQALDNCNVALCLVSGNFLGSSFIRTEELPQLLKAKVERGVRFFWLHLSPSIWKQIKVGDRKPFEEIQAVWPPDPSLAELSEVLQEKALVETAIAIVDSMNRE